MKKIILLAVPLLLCIAWLTRPDDKACIIGGVQAVWGSGVPSAETQPTYFEQFMNLMSEDIVVKDWLFVKQIKYKANKKETTVALGAFKNVFALVAPARRESNIPPMPAGRPN